MIWLLDGFIDEVVMIFDLIWFSGVEVDLDDYLDVLVEVQVDFGVC